MMINIDRRIYSDAVISKAVYWLSGDHTIVRTILDNDTETLSISPIRFESTEASIFIKFMGLLNDFKLRNIIAEETREIKTILYAKAFADDDELTEKDIHD